jgi:hypothetical protein
MNNFSCWDCRPQDSIYEEKKVFEFILTAGL